MEIKHKTIRDISRETGLAYSTVRDRWKRGKRGKDLVAPPKEHLQRSGRYTIFDDGESLHEISLSTGIQMKTLHDRYRRGDRGKVLRRPLKNESETFLGFTVRQLTDLIIKRGGPRHVEVTNVGSYLRYRTRTLKISEEDAVKQLLSYYNVKLEAKG